MKASIAGAAAAAVLLALASSGAEACGDKFVRVGRGGRFQRGYVAVHPAAILVFVNKASAGAPSMRKLPATLKAAGHTATAVDTPAAFAEAIKGRRYDLVLAEIGDLPSLTAFLPGSGPRPDVLPVLRKPTPAQAEAANKEHVCVIEDPDKKYDMLLDIDGAMERRKK